VELGVSVTVAVGPCRELGASQTKTPLSKTVFLWSPMLSARKPRAIVPTIEYKPNVREFLLTVLVRAGLAAVNTARGIGGENAMADDNTVKIPSDRAMAC
jgi:hypothetical protein